MIYFFLAENGYWYWGDPDSSFTTWLGSSLTYDDMLEAWIASKATP